MHTHLHTYTCPHAYHTHMRTCIYIHTYSCTYMHLCSDKYTFMNTNYIHTGPCTHTCPHTHICTHMYICFLNICLSYHACTSFVFPFTYSLCTALLLCLRDALDGYRQFSRHRGSLFMRFSAILMAGLGGPPSL